MQKIVLLLILTIPILSSEYSANDSVQAVSAQGFDKTYAVQRFHDLCLDTLRMNPSLAETYAQKALQLARVQSDTSVIVECLLISSRVKRTQGNYEAAMQYDFEALSLSEKYDSDELKSDALNTIGINHYRLREYDEAMSKFRESLSIRTQLGDSAGVADLWNNIGMVQDDTGKPQEALQSYRRALKVFTVLDFQDARADTYNNMAGVFYRTGDRDSLVYYANKSIDIKRELNDYVSISFGLINLGLFYYFTGDSQVAIEYLNEGLAIAKDNALLSQMSRAYSNLSDIYADAGDFEQAYAMHKSYTQVQDSILNLDKQRSVEELKMQYETEKQEQSIALLSRENQIQDLSIQRNRSLWIFFSLLSAFLGAIFILLLSRHRERLKLNRELADKNQQLSELNATKDKFFAIISHDLKNPLSAFRSISSALDENLESLSSNELKYFSNQLTKSADSLLEMLKNLLDWALTQTGRLKPEPKALKFADACMAVIQTLKPHADTKQVKLVCQNDADFSLMADARMLETVLRNLLTNAIKFSPEGGTVKISAWINESFVCFSVKDEGIGISHEDQKKLFRIDEDVRKIGNHEQKGSGLGLILCHEMVLANDGKIRVKSELGKGCEFVVELPKA